MARRMIAAVRTGVLLALVLGLAVPVAAQSRLRRSSAKPKPASTPVAPVTRNVIPVTVTAPEAVSAAPVSAAVHRDVQSRTPGFRHTAVETYAISRLDDNVNRDPVGVTSVGGIGGGTVRYASAAVRPLLQLEYDAAVHRYTATTRFNRVSQRARITLSKRVVKWWTLDLLTEGSLRGSGEDRDVADQLLVLPQTEFRLSSTRRVRVAVAQRWRRFPTDTVQNARNRYVLTEFRQRFADGGEFEAEARMESNLAVGDRFDFQRPTLSLSYGLPIRSAVRFEVGAQYRRQRYSGRFAEVDNVDVPRVDHRLQPSAELQVRFGTSTLEMSYEPEWRRSNDPDKQITQNLWQVGLRRRWF